MRYLTEARLDASKLEKAAFAQLYRGSALILHTIKGGTLRNRVGGPGKPRNTLAGQTLAHQPASGHRGPEGFHDADQIQDRRFHREALILLQDVAGGTTGTIRVGRVGRCDVVVNDYSVSGIHANFVHRVRGAAAQVCDCNSRNGTFLNGEKLAPEKWEDLHSGDTICMGRVEMIYIDAQDFYGFLRGSFSNLQLEAALGTET
jgi:hypothetical protein